MSNSREDALPCALPVVSVLGELKRRLAASPSGSGPMANVSSSATDPSPPTISFAFRPGVERAEAAAPSGTPDPFSTSSTSGAPGVPGSPCRGGGTSFQPTICVTGAASDAPLLSASAAGLGWPVGMGARSALAWCEGLPGWPPTGSSG